MAKNMAGGWKKYNCVDKKASKVFDTATKGMVGVKYTPMCVATQVVNGTNYSFFCNAKTVYPDSPNQAAIVDIYQKPKGKPQVVKINHVSQ